MQFKFKIFHLLLALPLLAYLTMQPVIVGSNNAVSVQPQINFPASDNNNTMLSFGWFKNGFTLQNAATTCTYDNVFPVSGTVALNGGTLTLNQDLIFHDNATLTSLGTIMGGGHYINFCSSITSFPSSVNTFNNCSLFINNDFTITSSVIFQGNCVFNGNGNSLVLGSGGYIVVAANSTLQIVNTTVQNVNGVNLYCTNNTSQLILEKDTFVQNGNFSFPNGSILVNNTVDWLGSYTFTYASSQSSTISSEATLHFSEGTYFSIGKFSAGTSIQPLVMTDSSSLLQLENCTFHVNGNGMNLLKGKVAIVRDVTIDIASSSTATGFILGDGTSAHDIFFELYPACTLDFSQGAMVFDVTSLNILESKASSATVYREAASIFYVMQSINLSNLIIEEEPGTTTIVTAGHTTLFNNVTIVLPQGQIILNGYNLSAISNALTGNQSILVESGALPLITYVSNSGNVIAGSGNITGPILLQDSNTQLAWGLNGQLLYDMLMNGGTVTLTSDMNLGSDIVLSGSGVVVLNNNILSYGQVDMTITDSLSFIGSRDAVNLYSNITLDSTWTFSGQCVLDGNGHSLDLTNGAIVLAPGCSLTITNISLKGIANNISCQDNTAQLTLENVDWLQSGYLDFAQGGMTLQNSVFMHGNAIFAYTSSQTCVFDSHAQVTLDTGFTFSYDATSPSLFQFADDTAQLTINDQGTLYATVVGLDLLKGSLIINNNGQLTNDSASTHGINFGDCTNAANDLQIIINVNGNLFMNNGVFNYKNINASSLLMLSQTSNFALDNGTFNVYQNIDGQGELYLYNNCLIGVAPSASLNISYNPQAGSTYSFVTIPDC